MRARGEDANSTQGEQGVRKHLTLFIILLCRENTCDILVGEALLGEKSLKTVCREVLVSPAGHDIHG